MLGWCRALQLLHLATQDFARGEALREVTQLFTVAAMTALRKPDEGALPSEESGTTIEHWDPREEQICTIHTV